MADTCKHHYIQTTQPIVRETRPFNERTGRGGWKIKDVLCSRWTCQRCGAVAWFPLSLYRGVMQKASDIQPMEATI